MVKRSIPYHLTYLPTLWRVNVCTDVAITLTPELDKRAKVLVLEVKVRVDTVF